MSTYRSRHGSTRNASSSQAGRSFAPAATSSVPNVRFTKIYYNSPGPDNRTNASLNAEYVQITNRCWGSKNYIWNNDGDTATLKTKSGTVVHNCTWGRGGAVTSCAPVPTVKPTTKPTTTTPTTATTATAPTTTAPTETATETAGS